MAFERAKRQTSIAANIGVNRSKVYDIDVQTAKQAQIFLSKAQDVFIKEFEEAEIKKGERLAAESTPIYSEIEIPSQSGGTKKAKYVSGYNRPLAFNSSYAAETFDDEILKRYVDAAVADINTVIEDKRSIAVQNNDPRDDLVMVTNNFLSNVSPSVDLILAELPDKIANAIRPKSKNLITAAVTELQNNHIGEAKSYNNFLAKNNIDTIEAASKNAFIDVKTFLDIKNEKEEELEISKAKLTPYALGYTQQLKPGYDVIAKNAGKFNPYFRYDIKEPSDIANGMSNTIRIRLAAQTGQGKIQLYNFDTKKMEEFDMSQFPKDTLENVQFMNQLTTVAGQQYTILSQLGDDFTVFNLYQDLKNNYQRTGSTYEISKSDKIKLANAVADEKTDVFKDLLYEYNVTNDTSFNVNNAPDDVKLAIQLDVAAKYQLVPSNIQRGLENLANADTIESIMDLYNGINFRQITDYKFLSSVKDKPAETELRKENILEYLHDKELRDYLMVLDNNIRIYGEAVGINKFYKDRTKLQEMVAKGQDYKTMMIATGVSEEDFKDKFSSAKLKSKIISTINSEEGFLPTTDVGINVDLVNMIQKGVKTHLLLGANKSNSNIEKLIKDQYRSAQTHMGLMRSKFNIGGSGILTDNEDPESLDFYVSRFPIDPVIESPVVRKYVDDKLNSISKIRNLRTDEELGDYELGNNVFLVTLGKPMSYNEVVYQMVYVPDKSDPGTYYPMIADSGRAITIEYNEMMRDTRVSFAPVVDITDPDFEIKQNQPLATDDFGSGAVR